MATALLLGDGRLATAQELRSSGFQIQYDAGGIRSLKRAGDIYDTDYIAANGRLGRLMVRYRGTPNGDWRELQEMLLRSATASSIQFELGRLHPTLAQRASPIAERGVGAGFSTYSRNLWKSRARRSSGYAAAELARVLALSPAHRPRRR